MTIVEAEENIPEDGEEEEIPVDETSPEAAPEAPADVEEAPMESGFYPRTTKIMFEDECASAPSGPRHSTRYSMRSERDADWSRNRRSTIRRVMRSAKQSERVELEENIYSLLIVSEYMSWPFIFCLGAYLIKMALLGVLLSDINIKKDYWVETPKLTAVKTILIPLAIAMQEDLMQSFYFFANVKYCPDILRFSQVATKERFYIAYTLRTIDGILSLFSNYFIMLLTTERILHVFLNFAALQFLYDIDDVFYELATLGFFGDTLEELSRQVKNITLRRRFGTDDTKILGFIRVSFLDTLLFIISLIICYTVFALVTVSKYDPDRNIIDIGTAPPSLSSMPSVAPTLEPSFAPSNFTGNITDDVLGL